MLYTFEQHVIICHHAVNFNLQNALVSCRGLNRSMQLYVRCFCNVPWSRNGNDLKFAQPELAQLG